MQKRPTYLVATDGSAGGKEALREAIELARASHAMLSIVYVRPAPLPMFGDPLYQRALTEALASARTIVNEASAEAAGAGVTTQVDILEGDPSERIIELGAARDADLIVVGSRGRNRVTSTVLGSVSDAVSQKADRPVLVVRPHHPAVKRAA
jgi:nucleotide-binding universal stress UspA family protein